MVAYGQSQASIPGAVESIFEANSTGSRVAPRLETKAQTSSEPKGASTLNLAATSIPCLPAAFRYSVSRTSSILPGEIITFSSTKVPSYHVGSWVVHILLYSLLTRSRYQGQWLSALFSLHLFMICILRYILLILLFLTLTTFGLTSGICPKRRVLKPSRPVGALKEVFFGSIAAFCTRRIEQLL